MQIQVGPARRLGITSTIFDQPLAAGDLNVDPGGNITLTVDASGMKDERSRYRYRISFTADDVKRLAEK
jgi:hypothetical protein